MTDERYSPPATASARARRKAKCSLPARARPIRNNAESPIAWLYTRRGADGQPLIGEAEFNAGERLRADFHFARMSPNVTQSWSQTAGTGGGRRGAPGADVDLADNVIAAAERVRRALASVGPELSGILIDVCGHLKGLEDVERGAKWPQRSAKIVLGMALAALARHYGFATPERTRPRVAAVRHWGAEGYRPTMSDDDASEEG